MVIEYIGEMIKNELADVREQTYNRQVNRRDIVEYEISYSTVVNIYTSFLMYMYTAISRRYIELYTKYAITM